ncbi:hypothetical protein KC347_g4 [Hortaea werneckii]|nr:hypothetical protein KC347_g4 [Hortaea werneckii]
MHVGSDSQIAAGPVRAEGVEVSGNATGGLRPSGLNCPCCLAAEVPADLANSGQSPAGQDQALVSVLEGEVYALVRTYVGGLEKGVVGDVVVVVVRVVRQQGGGLLEVGLLGLCLLRLLLAEALEASEHPVEDVGVDEVRLRSSALYGAGKVNNKAQQQMYGLSARRAREYLVPHDDGTCAPSRQSAKRALRNLSPVGMDCPRAVRDPFILVPFTPWTASYIMSEYLSFGCFLCKQTSVVVRCPTALSHAGTLRSELHYYHLNRRSTAILRNTKSVNCMRSMQISRRKFISSSVMEIFGGFHRERNSAKRISRPLYSAEKDETELPTATVPVHNRSQSLCTASEGFPLEAVAVLKDCGYILGLVGGFQQQAATQWCMHWKARIEGPSGWWECTAVPNGYGWRVMVHSR